ncbi:putative non-specific lipid-transfer protein 14 [Carya illinoinensis]|uniref:Bifunctional inhibitor/plant lipid transfer protein/seed storage helical domain-containing protein n=1 Tax=Carya illinoinensis TaxID=32201 RepID=A0A8T1QZ66_CARIL|nr:putative non-specific lipid-transfer protein 14 [Carya illinoinensis]KAG6660400.1 hypothetical protein CIPAW_03G103600 [Carya illinoinensis]
MGFYKMDRQKATRIFGISMLVSLAISVSAANECSTVRAFVSACHPFVTYGTPDPFPGSPCCDAMMALNAIADSADDRRVICGCMMDLITTFNPNATAIATLPGLCGASLGFTIDPDTDCSFIS